MNAEDMIRKTAMNFENRKIHTGSADVQAQTIQIRVPARSMCSEKSAPSTRTSLHEIIRKHDRARKSNISKTPNT